MKILRKKKYNILSSFVKYGFVLVIAFTLFAPLTYVSACGEPGGTPCPANTDNTGQHGNSTVDNTKGIDKGLNISTGIKNPLSDRFKDIPTFIEGVLRFVLLIGIPIVTLAIIYTGFLFVTAQGNSEKIKKAKQALIYTLVGAALLLGSLVITEAIKGSVDQIKSTS